MGWGTPAGCEATRQGHEAGATTSTSKPGTAKALAGLSWMFTGDDDDDEKSAATFEQGFLTVVPSAKFTAEGRCHQLTLHAIIFPIAVIVVVGVRMEH